MSNYPVKNVYVATDGISEKKFIRNSLIYLYSAKDAPASIADVKLSKVGLDQIQCVWQANLFDATYDVEIGYHRNEQYLDTEKYYDSTLKAYTTRTVVKNRKVTDWQPYSSSKNNIWIFKQRWLETKSLRDMDQLDPEMQKKYDDARYEYDCELGDSRYAEVNGADREAYINELTDDQCVSIAYEAKNDYTMLRELRNTFPGDTYRNLRYDCELKDIVPEVYVLKRYKMSFECPEAKGFILQTEHGSDPVVHSNFHDTDNTVNELEEAKKKQIDSDPLIQEKKQMLGKKELYTYLPSAAVVLLGLAFNFLLLLLGIAGVVATYLYFRNTVHKPMDERKAQISAEYDAKIKAYKESGIQSRIDSLNARLAEMGQPELTKKELRWFTDKDLEHTLEEERDEDEQDDDEDDDEVDLDEDDEVDLDDEEDEE